MRNQETFATFYGVVNQAVSGGPRTINDGSPSDGMEFLVESHTVQGIAENLTDWWHDKTNEEPTQEEAEEYFDEIYPEA